MNKRAVGDKFEKELSKLLNISRTAMSGGYWNNGDLEDHRVVIEAKVKDSDFFKPCKKEVQKVITQAYKANKDWIYIQRTNNEDFVMLSLNLLLEIAAKEDYFSGPRST